MKILNAEQIRELDTYTIENEPISSILLMERASRTFTDWFLNVVPDSAAKVAIFCGIGNNGGDGLAIARQLHYSFYEVVVYLCLINEKTSNDYKLNLERLKKNKGITILSLPPDAPVPQLVADRIVIDAIFGSGLNRPVEGYWAQLIEGLNRLPNRKISVDIPSGLFVDEHSPGTVFSADRTLSFELPKLAFLFPENQNAVGRWEARTIGLHAGYLQQIKTRNYYLDQYLISKIHKDRSKFSHKGNYGHALLMAGQYGSIGAATLAAKACLRSGTGLVTVHAPKCAYQILQISLPEAMVSIDAHEMVISGQPENLDKYNSIGVGCGIGTHALTAMALQKTLSAVDFPVVIDADALNLISHYPDLFDLIPKNSILTPHPKEFERLFGKTQNDFDRNQLQREKAQSLGVYILLKGAHSCIATPEGECYFNSTGNPGMATGGSGDVLTGIITGMLAQEYTPFEAVVLAVYLHGLSGDLAADKWRGQEALIASDLIEHLGDAFQYIHTLANDENDGAA